MDATPRPEPHADRADRRRPPNGRVDRLQWSLLVAIGLCLLGIAGTYHAFLLARLERLEARQDDVRERLRSVEDELRPHQRPK